MIQQLGDFQAGVTLDMKWNTNGQDGASITRGTNGTIRIYKNNSTTERSSSNGITDTEDHDTLTGVHHLRIDLSDNTDAGFYASGNDYFVVLQGAVIDTKTVNVCLAQFSIANRKVQDLSATAKASVNAEVVDTLATDTYAQPGQGAPAATTSLSAMIRYLYKWARNKKDNDGTNIKYYADDESTVDHKQTVAESSGTVTKGEIVTGP